VLAQTSSLRMSGISCMLDVVFVADRGERFAVDAAGPNLGPRMPRSAAIRLVRSGLTVSGLSRALHFPCVWSACPGVSWAAGRRKGSGARMGWGGGSGGV